MSAEHVHIWRPTSFVCSEERILGDRKMEIRVSIECQCGLVCMMSQYLEFPEQRSTEEVERFNGNAYLVSKEHGLFLGAAGEEPAWAVIEQDDDD